MNFRNHHKHMLKPLKKGKHTCGYEHEAMFIRKKTRAAIPRKRCRITIGLTQENLQKKSWTKKASNFQIGFIPPNWRNKSHMKPTTHHSPVMQLSHHHRHLIHLMVLVRGQTKYSLKETISQYQSYGYYIADVISFKPTNPWTHQQSEILVTHHDLSES